MTLDPDFGPCGVSIVTVVRKRKVYVGNVRFQVTADKTPKLTAAISHRPGRPLSVKDTIKATNTDINARSIETADMASVTLSIMLPMLFQASRVI